MKLEIRYRTRFHYDELVAESHNELRACPVDDGVQRLLDYRVTVAPAARVLSFVDAWGTRVDAFGIRRPHLAMEVLAEADVETAARPLPAVSVPMARLADARFEEEHLEYLQPGRHTAWAEGVAATARRQAELAGDDVVGTVLAVHRFVGTHMAYVPGSTHIGIPVEEVLGTGRGVCQDYAHLAVALCRSLAIPARYVSGYLFAVAAGGVGGDEPDRVRATTHAWFEASIPGWGWLALDPTNREPAGERHVKVGHGRDYDDVLPFRGAYTGPSGAAAHAEVELRRVADAPARAARADGLLLQAPAPPTYPLRPADQ